MHYMFSADKANEQLFQRGEAQQNSRWERCQLIGRQITKHDRNTLQKKKERKKKDK